MEDQDHTEDQDYKEDQDHMEDQDHVEDQDHMEDQDHKVDQGHTDIVRIFSHFTCLVGFTRNLNSEGVRYTSGGHYAVDTLSYVRTQFWGCNVYQVSWLAYVLRLAVNFYTISRAQSVQYLKSTQSVMHVMHVMTHDFFRRPMVFIPMLPTVLSLTHSSDTTHLSDTSNILLISYSITAKLKIRHLVLFLNMLQVFSET